MVCNSCMDLTVGDLLAVPSLAFFLCLHSSFMTLTTYLMRRIKKLIKIFICFFLSNSFSVDLSCFSQKFRCKIFLILRTQFDDKESKSIEKVETQRLVWLKVSERNNVKLRIEIRIDAGKHENVKILGISRQDNARINYFCNCKLSGFRRQVATLVATSLSWILFAQFYHRKN